jgi:hypothetical protein
LIDGIALTGPCRIVRSAAYHSLLKWPYWGI